MTEPRVEPSSSPATGSEAIDEWMDEALAPFALFVDALTIGAEPLLAAPPGLAPDGRAEGMYVEELRVDLPVELEILVDDSGAVRLAGSPPTQYTQTTIMPVFHQMTLSVTAKRSDG